MQVLVALHGFTGGGGDFAPLVKTFPAWRWNAPDLPGHSPDLKYPNAPKDDCTLAANLEFLDSLIPEKSSEASVLLGYSLGGRLALRYALSRPGRVAALVLIGAAGIRHLTGYSRTHEEARAHVVAKECPPA